MKHYEAVVYRKAWQCITVRVMADNKVEGGDKAFDKAYATDDWEVIKDSHDNMELTEIDMFEEE